MDLHFPYDIFYTEAQVFLKDRIYKDYLRRLVYGTDASCYRYIPQLVIKAINEEEIIKIYTLARRYQIPLTFRAAGSSLSGQACAKGVLVMASFGWQEIEVKEGGASISLGCGVIGAHANDALKSYHKKIGPDPATIATAMMGGILANNASGMCCGVKQNSYQTLKSLRLILVDGTILDTSNLESIARFKKSHAKLLEGLLDLRAQVLADSELSALIAKKYQIKNTTGYSLNALLDFSDPIDILSHLFVGSEGTLGFISACELECVEDAPFKTCLLLFYQDLRTTIQAVRILAQHADKISAAEVMDYACLKSVQGLEGMPAILQEIQTGNGCILAQLEHSDLHILEDNTQGVLKALEAIPTILPLQQSSDSQEYNAWWKIRKGIFPIVAGKRRYKASVITEDICFEMDKLSEGITQLEILLEKHGFKDHSVIFGHALSGNLHFLITPLLDVPQERANFANLVTDMAHMVADLQGSIKAEHGTGRMVAPFVELEWGAKAYAIHKQIKALLDPQGILNPDVILSDDPHIHTKNLKSSASVEPELEACMECGFCERICPSRYLSLTPRQRIVLHKEIAYLTERVEEGYPDRDLLEELLTESAFLSEETCAVCHMCATLCPLEIDTGSIALQRRQKQHKGHAIAHQVLKHMDKSISMVKMGLGLARAGQVTLGAERMQVLAKKAHFKVATPALPKYLPSKNTHVFANKHAQGDKSVIYFSTCINRAFAPSKYLKDKRPLQEVFESLCAKAGYSVIYPPTLPKLCCGKAFINYIDLSASNRTKNVRLLQELSGNGKIPIVLDHSACSTHLIQECASLDLPIYDLPIFIVQHLRPHLHLTPLDESIGLYTMCAAKRAGYETQMLDLARACVRGEVVVHAPTGCCGFAGDKGFLTPELNAYALIDFAKFYQSKGLQRGFASSSTCEIGLSGATSMSWQHIAYLVDTCAQGDLTQPTGILHIAKS